MVSSTKPPRLSLSERLERSRQHRRQSRLLESSSMGGASFCDAPSVSAVDLSSSEPSGSSKSPAHAAIGQRRDLLDANPSVADSSLRQQEPVERCMEEDFAQEKPFGQVIEPPTLSVAALRASFSGLSNKKTAPKESSSCQKRYSAPSYTQLKGPTQATDSEKQRFCCDGSENLLTTHSESFPGEQSKSMCSNATVNSEKEVEKDAIPPWQNRARKHKPWQRDSACSNLDSWQMRQRKNASNLLPNEVESLHNSDPSNSDNFNSTVKKQCHSSCHKVEGRVGKLKMKVQNPGAALQMSEDDSLYIEDDSNVDGTSSFRRRPEETRESPPRSSSIHIRNEEYQTSLKRINYPMTFSFSDSGGGNSNDLGFGEIITRNQSKQMVVWGSENQTSRTERVVASTDDRDDDANFDEGEEWFHRDPSFPDQASISSSPKDPKSLSGYEIRVTTNRSEATCWDKQLLMDEASKGGTCLKPFTPSKGDNESFDPFSDVDNIKLTNTKNMFASTSDPFLSKEVFSPPSWTPPGQKHSQSSQKRVEI